MSLLDRAPTRQRLPSGPSQRVIDFHIGCLRELLPILARVFRMHKRVVGIRWRYRNNIVEQDHRTVKGVTDKMLVGFTSFWNAKKRIVGLGAMHTLNNGQLHCPNGQAMAAAE